METTPSFAENLPTEIPVFPLPGALLLPRGKLPLNIFEPRYLAMTEDALAAGRMFGMIQPDRARPEEPTGPALFRVGCLGRLSSFAETDDGRYLITLTGMIRFRVAEELEMRRGYRRVRAEYKSFATDLAAPGRIGVGRETIMKALREFFAARGMEANWEAIERMPDDALVVTLAMACPFDVAEKQALLEAASDADRAETLVALLRMAAHEAGSDETRNVS
jgi:hypothetical protein